MKTYFAPAERADPPEIERQVAAISRSPVVDGVMMAVDGLLAVLNGQRQVLAVNDLLLRRLGIEDASSTLGLRPGEVLQCVHAREMPGGCGTSRFCSTCGAAIAIVTSLGSGRPEERLCALTVEKEGAVEERFLKVRSSPLHCDGERFLLVLLHDITQLHRWGLLEHAFFHDISNLVQGISGMSEILARTATGETKALAGRLHGVVNQLVREMMLQKELAGSEHFRYRTAREELGVGDVLENLHASFESHPKAQGKTVDVAPVPEDLRLAADPSLLGRVLGNMVVNALEATPAGGTVRVRADGEESAIHFSVANDGLIPEDVARRVFQRHFSTREGPGRGMGTYMMKLFGEEIMDGEVSFTSRPGEGTVFSLRLPR